MKRINMENRAKEIKAAYAYCQKIAQDHYENFPVASVILPKRIREPITVIYAFARIADDIADEGNFSMQARLEKLAQFTFYLDNLNTDYHAIESLKYKENLTPPNNTLTPGIELIFLALQHAIHTHQLPIALFYDLLSAFKQDVIQTDYQTFEEVLQYCRYSANPIGRLLLHLNGGATQENLLLSDQICTGLQLINFMQDLGSDLKDRNRCYIPMEDLQTFHITKQQLLEMINQSSHRTHSDPYRYEVQLLLDFQLNRIQQLYDSGKSLGSHLNGLFGLEIRLMIAGGQQILNKLKTRQYFARPTLNKLDWLLAFWQAISFSNTKALFESP